LQQVEKQTVQHIESYRFDLVSRDLYEFVWNDYCDWYIELSKPVLYSDDYDNTQKSATRHTLVTVLETVLRLLHPIMPYITEELWQRIAPLASVKAETIMLCAYPQADDNLIDTSAIEAIEWVKQFVMGVRQIRSEMNIKPGKPLPVYCHHGNSLDQQRLDQNRSLLISLARLESINWLESNDAAPKSATSLVGDMSLLIPLAGLIDKDAELKRLQKNIEKIEAETKRIETKLGNENFVARAPAAVVDRESEKLAEARSALASLQSQAERINSIS
jgi:valyl-tRNA synthetase